MKAGPHQKWADLANHQNAGQQGNQPHVKAHITVQDMAELMGYIAEIEQDPFIIYEKIEEVYRPNFFEGVIYKKFAHLFDENTEESFKA